MTAPLLPRFAVLLALALALGSCAGGDDYPSLARRPAERLDTGTPSVPASAEPTLGTPDSATTAKLAELQQTAHAAHERFAAHRAPAERAVGAAGPLGSDSWGAASVALAELEAAHDQQAAALTTIDQMQVDRQVADAGADSADSAAIGAARDAVAADVDTDGGMLARLRERLAR